MDRQSLLEQKRKRLEELRQRRLASAELTPPDIPDSIEPQAPKVVKVDVSVQTNSASVAVGEHKVSDFTEITRFSKGIQTDKKTDSTVSEQPVIEEAPSPVVIKYATHVNESEINQLLKQALILLHEMTSLETKKASRTTSASEKEMFTVLNEVSTARVPISIEPSPHRDEVLVNFGGSSSEEYQGFAVIYVNSGGKLTPVDFLASLSPITSIKFDEFSDLKVIGGLQNGRVVVWDLLASNNDAVKFPTLYSPNDYSNSSLHRAPITSILQVSTEPNTFITTCYEGLINVWSSNFLEYPKFEAVVLPNETDENMGMLAAKSRTIKHAIILKSGDVDVLKDYKFLNQMLIGTESGTLHGLTNDAKLGYINLTIGSKIIGSLHAIGYIDDLPIIVTSCFESNIYVYNGHKEILRLVTNYMVLGVEPRPGHQFQFLSYGMPSEEGQAVEFWDLGVNIRAPLYTSHVESQPVSAGFDRLGKYVYIGGEHKLTVLEVSEDLGVKGDTIHDIV